MNTVYLALGSNVGDSVQNISKAINLLSPALQDIKLAPIYSTKAVGYTNQPDFFNTAISGKTELSPQELLKFTDKVEKLVGRVKRFRWGPREIDIDIIFYGNLILETERLTIPHPNFRERDFVLKPIVDLNNKQVDPVSLKTVKQIFDQLDPSKLSIIH
jgi:2-amino-4-hydroxy-6-hydroxymethyldihydropteridine diphosphokinase